MHDQKGQKQSRILILLGIGMVVGVSIVTLFPIERLIQSSVALAADRSQKEGKPGSLGVFEDFAQGQAFLNEQKYEKAIKAFNQAESNGVTLYELYLFRGAAYHEIGQFQNAKRDAEKAIELQPARMLGYELLAGVAVSSSSLEDAIKILTNALTKVEGIEKAQLMKTRGRFLLNGERQKDAIRDLTHAIDMGDTSAATYYLRGDAHKELGRYELAIQDYSEALAIQPTHHSSLRSRGWTYGCIGEYEKGLSDLNQLLASSPEDLWARQRRGWVRLELDDKQGALADLSYALAAGSKNPWTFLNAAAAYSLQENMAKALEVNAQGLALKDPEAEYMLQFQRGLLLLISGQGGEAEKFYKKAELSALKSHDPLELQEAIADLKEEMHLHSHIASIAEPILKELEHTLAKTKAPHKPRPNQCQRLKKRK